MNAAHHATTIKIGHVNNTVNESNIGPTKRSADFNEYVDLEAKLAKANTEIAQLKAQLKKAGKSLPLFSKEEIQNIFSYSDLRDVALELRFKNQRESESYAKAQESGQHYTPVIVVDTNRNYVQDAIKIANLVASKFGR